MAFSIYELCQGIHHGSHFGSITMLQNAMLWRMRLEDEIRIAGTLIRKGLSEIQHTDEGNEVWFVPMLLCSSGIERVLKCMHIIGSLKLVGAVPTTKEMKSIGHSITSLLDAFLERYFVDSGLSALQADRHLLSTNEDVRTIVDLFSEFGYGGRYFNIDYLTRAKGDSDKSTERRLRDHLHRWIGDSPEVTIALSEPAFYRTVARQSRTRLVITIEVIMRALARQFTLGGLVPEGRPFVVFISHYLDLWEPKLGKTDYSKLGF